MNAEIQRGDPAPDFQAASAATGDDPGTFNLAGLRGERVVLCFYPYDDVPAADEQLDALRDAWDRLQEEVALFGVSRDTPDNHHRVIARLGLPFALLTDDGNHIAKAYGVWLGDGGGGDTEGGSLTERATFIIAADGRIETILRDENAARHVRRLLAMLDV